MDDERTVKNRIHLDLASQDDSEQDATVERLVAAGARHVDIGQHEEPGGVPWVVLADPEGNEFCVLDPRHHYQGIGPIAAIVVDCADPAAMATFWEQAAGWTIADQGPDTAGLRPGEPGEAGRGPWLEFLRTGEPHTVKNRIHLDVAPFTGDDQAAEVNRLIAAGTVRTEVGQSAMEPADLTWVVLTDPENNEFCILSPR